MVATPPPEQGGTGASGDFQVDGTTLWSQILDLVRQEVNEQTFNTWFTQTRFLGLDHSQLRLQGPNQFFVDWLTEHHLDLLERHTKLFRHHHRHHRFGTRADVAGTEIEVYTAVAE